MCKRMTVKFNSLVLPSITSEPCNCEQIKLLLFDSKIKNHLKLCANKKNLYFSALWR